MVLLENLNVCRLGWACLCPPAPASVCDVGCSDRQAVRLPGSGPLHGRGIGICESYFLGLGSHPLSLLT